MMNEGINIQLDSEESSLERKSSEKRFGLMAGGESGSDEASNRFPTENIQFYELSNKFMNS